MRGVVSYVLVLSIEEGPAGLVQDHDDGHQVFAVHDGRGHDVTRLVFCELVHKVAEVLVLHDDNVWRWPHSQFKTFTYLLTFLPTDEYVLYLY